MKNNLLSCLIVVSILFVFAILFKTASNIFGKSWINILFIFPIVYNGYYIVKNGINKDDFKFCKIKNENVETNGGVALIWFLFSLLIWTIWIILN